MSGSVLFSGAALFLALRHNTVIAVSTKGYGIVLAIGAIYGLTGVLVWFGRPLGRYLNYACSLIYLTRPRLGLRLWADMRSSEFRAYFAPSRKGGEVGSKEGT